MAKDHIAKAKEIEKDVHANYAKEKYRFMYESIHEMELQNKYLKGNKEMYKIQGRGDENAGKKAIEEIIKKNKESIRQTKMQLDFIAKQL